MKKKKLTLKQQKAAALKELRRAIKEYKDFHTEIARCNRPFLVRKKII